MQPWRQRFPIPGAPIGSTLPLRNDKHPQSSRQQPNKYKGKEKVSSSAPRRKVSKKQVGEGIFYDEQTGNVIWNPGRWTERIISQKESVIPREQQRVITSNPPVNIYERNPQFGRFQAAGLQWQGQSCVTGNQLYEQQQHQIGANLKRARQEESVNFDSTIMSNVTTQSSQTPMQSSQSDSSAPPVMQQQQQPLKRVCTQEKLPIRRPSQ